MNAYPRYTEICNVVKGKMNNMAVQNQQIGTMGIIKYKEHK
jgi:hypothetical protein